MCLVLVYFIHQQVVQALSAIGGVNVRDNVKNILEKLMSNELISLFNMKGNNNKLSFKSSAICGIVIASAMKTKVKEGMTEHESTRRADYLTDIVKLTYFTFTPEYCGRLEVLSHCANGLFLSLIQRVYNEFSHADVVQLVRDEDVNVVSFIAAMYHLVAVYMGK
ncbi:hypothetical protein MAR_000394 [Mya arenaria]|uniref:Uncharacterized protein n=1 Tax=Mya arenaria TaxID=6604 RepID=A0ABY7FC48_MYAAR|nr:hypothetical protein MAR_000394 [Mya arenaria]